MSPSRIPDLDETDEVSSCISRGRETSGVLWSFTEGLRMKGRTIRDPVLGSEKATSARVPVIAGEVGFMPHATQPDGDMKEPVKARSNVAFFAWYVQASVAPCVGREMHFW